MRGTEVRTGSAVGGQLLLVRPVAQQAGAHQDDVPAVHRHTLGLGHGLELIGADRLAAWQRIDAAIRSHVQQHPARQNGR